MRLGIINEYSERGFEYVRSLGLDFIEICCNFDGDNENLLSSVSQIKNSIRETGVAVGSLGRWNSPLNKGGVIDEKLFDDHKKLINAAKELGSPVYVCGINYDNSVSMYKNYGTAIEFFSKLCEIGKDLGIKVGAYNCEWENFVNSPKQWEIVLDSVPDLGIKYDCSHCIGRGGDYLAELKAWLPRIIHMHIKGVLKVNGEYLDDPPAGIDGIDWRKVFALIYMHGYDAGLSLEPHSSTWQGELGDAGVRFSVDYIKPFVLR